MDYQKITTSGLSLLFLAGAANAAPSLPTREESWYRRFDRKSEIKYPKSTQGGAPRARAESQIEAWLGLGAPNSTPQKPSRGPEECLLLPTYEFLTATAHITDVISTSDLPTFDCANYDSQVDPLALQEYDDLLQTKRIECESNNDFNVFTAGPRGMGPGRQCYLGEIYSWFTPVEETVNYGMIGVGDTQTESAQNCADWVAEDAINEESSSLIALGTVCITDAEANNKFGSFIGFSTTYSDFESSSEAPSPSQAKWITRCSVKQHLHGLCMTGNTFNLWAERSAIGCSHCEYANER